MNKSNFVHVATFGAPIGLKGDIKVNLLTSTIDVFRSLDQYYNFDQSIKWSFESVVMRQEKCVALPSHCKNRDDAEELKNQKIFSKPRHWSQRVIITVAGVMQQLRR